MAQKNIIFRFHGAEELLIVIKNNGGQVGETYTST